MAQALKFTIGGDATPFAAAMRTVEQIAQRSSRTTIAQLRQAQRVLTESLALDGPGKQFRAAALAEVTRELNRMEVAALKTEQATERLAEAQARVAMGRPRAQDLREIGAAMATGRMPLPAQRQAMRWREASAFWDEAVARGRADLETLIGPARQSPSARRALREQARLDPAAAEALRVVESERATRLIQLRRERAERDLANAARQYQFVRTRDELRAADLVYQRRLQHLARLTSQHGARQFAIGIGAPDLRQAAVQATQAGTILGQLRGMMSNLGLGLYARFLGVGAAIGSVYGAMRQLGESIQAFITMQRMATTLRSASDSAEEAADSILYLRREAQRIGFFFPAVADSFARFNVAAKSAGLSAGQTREIFSALAEASAVVGLTSERQAEAMLALEQMLARGSVMAQELRLQFGNAFPAGVAIFARALKVSQAELLKLMEQGKLISADVLPKVAKELRRSFSLTPEANRTAREIMRTRTAIFELQAEIGKNISPALLDFLERIMLVAREATDATGPLAAALKTIWTISGARLFGAAATWLGGWFGRRDVARAGDALSPQEIESVNARRLRYLELNRRRWEAEAAARRRAVGISEPIAALLAQQARENDLNALYAKRISLLEILADRTRINARETLALQRELLRVNQAIELGGLKESEEFFARIKALRQELAQALLESERPRPLTIEEIEQRTQKSRALAEAEARLKSILDFQARGGETAALDRMRQALAGFPETQRKSPDEIIQLAERLRRTGGLRPESALARAEIHAREIVAQRQLPSPAAARAEIERARAELEALQTAPEQLQAAAARRAKEARVNLLALADREADRLARQAATESNINDLIETRVRILALLEDKKSLPAHVVARLEAARRQAEFNLTVAIEPDQKKKLQMRANREREALAAARQELAAARAEFDQALATRQPEDVRDRARTRLITAQESVREAIIRVTTADQQAALAKSDAETQTAGRFALPITENQRLGAFVSGPDVALLDVNRSQLQRQTEMAATLQQILRVVATPTPPSSVTF